MGRPRQRGRQLDPDARHQLLVHGRQHSQASRVAFLPYLGPEGVGGYRKKCDEVAEKGYEGFVFTSQGQGGTVHTIAAE